MKLEFAQKIVDAMQGIGVEAYLQADYSGRGMFGKTTAGIVTHASHGPLIGYAAALALCYDEKTGDDGVNVMQDFDAIHELPNKSDTMGRDMIFY